MSFPEQKCDYAILEGDTWSVSSICTESNCSTNDQSYEADDEFSVGCQAGSASLLSSSATTLGIESELSKTVKDETKSKKRELKGAADTGKEKEGNKSEVDEAFQGCDLDATFPRQEPIELPGWHIHSETLPLIESEESVNLLEFWENKEVLHSGHKLELDKKNN